MKKVLEKGFNFITVPDLVTSQVLEGTGFNPRTSDQSDEYFIEEELVDIAKSMRTFRLVRNFLKENLGDILLTNANYEQYIPWHDRLYGLYVMFDNINGLDPKSYKEFFKVINKIPSKLYLRRVFKNLEKFAEYNEIAEDINKEKKSLGFGNNIENKEKKHYTKV